MTNKKVLFAAYDLKRAINGNKMARPKKIDVLFTFVDEMTCSWNWEYHGDQCLATEGLKRYPPSPEAYRNLMQVSNIQCHPPYS